MKSKLLLLVATIHYGLGVFVSKGTSVLVFYSIWQFFYLPGAGTMLYGSILVELAFLASVFRRYDLYLKLYMWSKMIVGVLGLGVAVKLSNGNYPFFILNLTVPLSAIGLGYFVHQFLKEG